MKSDLHNTQSCICRKTVGKSTKRLLIPLIGITVERSHTAIFRFDFDSSVPKLHLFLMTGRDETMWTQSDRYRGHYFDISQMIQSKKFFKVSDIINKIHNDSGSLDFEVIL